MSYVDYSMLEATSDNILNSIDYDNMQIISEDLENFLVSLASCCKDNIDLGPNSQSLEEGLDVLYSYDHIQDLEGFTQGAVWGALQFLSKYLELK